MATYNGVRFVAEQVQSILVELRDRDELIIVDDASSDGTLSLLQGIHDPRIRLFVNERNRGDVYTFGRAMSLARNDMVLLADQDDVWTSGRVETMRQALEHGAQLVTTNFDWISADGCPVEVRYDGVRAADSRRHLVNIAHIFLGRTNYFGCAMGFRGELKSLVLPIPSFVESHDLWVALAGNLVRSNCHLEFSSLRKRKHSSNATSTVSSRTLYYKLRARAIFLASIVVLASRCIGRRWSMQ